MVVLTRPAARFEQLLERAAQPTSLRVDRAGGCIRGVRVLGYTSANGRRYDKRAVQEALPFYQNLHVNIDHPARDNPNADRSLSSRFGTLRNARIDAGGIKADLFFVRSHAMAETVCEMAESFPSLLGMSHNAEGKTRRENGTTVVEEILSVRSCDVVADPATCKSLFESHRGGPGRTSGARAFFEAVTRPRRGLIEAAELDVPLDAAQRAEVPAAVDDADDDLGRDILALLDDDRITTPEEFIRAIRALLRQRSEAGENPFSPAKEEAAAEAFAHKMRYGTSLTEAKRFCDAIRA